jgi:hypothetical protein
MIDVGREIETMSLVFEEDVNRRSFGELEYRVEILPGE